MINRAWHSHLNNVYKNHAEIVHHYQSAFFVCGMLSKFSLIIIIYFSSMCVVNFDLQILNCAEIFNLWSCSSNCVAVTYVFRVPSPSHLLCDFLNIDIVILSIFHLCFVLRVGWCKWPRPKEKADHLTTIWSEEWSNHVIMQMWLPSGKLRHREPASSRMNHSSPSMTLLIPATMLPHSHPFLNPMPIKKSSPPP